MAESNEFKQVINDAILDADSLERFINGSEDETVLTRLSAEYPSLQNAIKQMFENGGLPATPFKTKADMEASELEDGVYAFVTDDVDDANNGVYLKETGVWNLSGINQGEIASYHKAFAPDSAINFDFNNNKIEVLEQMYVPMKTGRARIQPRVYDLDPIRDKNTALNVVIQVDLSTHRLSFADGTGVYKTPKNHIVIGGYHEGSGYVWGFDDDQVLINGKHYNESQALSVTQMVLGNSGDIHFDFKNNKIEVVGQMYVPMKNMRGRIQPRVYDLDADRNKSNPMKTIVLLSLDTHRLVFADEVADFSVPDNHVILGGYHEASGTIWGFPFAYINGLPYDPHQKYEKPSYHLSMASDGAVDFRFSEDKIVVSDRVNIPLDHARLRIQPREIPLDPGRNKHPDISYVVLASNTDYSITPAHNFSVMQLGSEYKIPKGSIIVGGFNEGRGEIWGMPYAYIDGKPQGKIERNIVPYPFDTTVYPSINVSDSFTSTDDIYINNLNSDIVYGWYDALMAKYPDYISRVELGMDASSTYPIYQYIFKPMDLGAEQEQGAELEKPRIMLQTIHGGELFNSIYPYIVLREMCDNWQNDKALEGLRWGAEIRVIPVGNPYALNNKQRPNANDVDINRNYPFYWEFSDVLNYGSGDEPLSEIETRLSYQAMLDFKPHILVDAHSFGEVREDGRIVWVTGYTKQDDYVVTKTLKRSYVEAYKKHENMVSYEGHADVSYYKTIRYGMAAVTRHVLGMLGGTVEFAWNMKGDVESEKRGSNAAVNYAANTYAFYIIQALDYLDKHGSHLVDVMPDMPDKFK